jgi:hypothetical protein
MAVLRVDRDLAIREHREECFGRMRQEFWARAFMAVGVLRGEKHSVMRDLESFWLLMRRFGSLVVISVSCRRSVSCCRSGLLSSSLL